MNYNNNTYAIISISEIGNINFSEILDNDSSSVRKNNSGTKFVIEWEGTMPLSVSSINPLVTGLTHEEILTELNKSEWETQE